MKHYNDEYVLLMDLPTGEKKGDHFFFCNNGSEVFYQVGKTMYGEYGFKPTIGEDKWYRDQDDKKTKISIDEMTSNFFEPIGESLPLYPPFPDKEDFKEYYYLLGESRLVDSVDVVRAVNEIFYSDEYYDACYELLKNMYNEKFLKK